MSDLKKRKGMVIISASLLEKPDESFNLLSALFSEFIPLFIENSFMGSHWDDRKYYGYSKHFDPVDAGTVVPTYSVIVRTDDKGSISSIEFKK